MLRRDFVDLSAKIAVARFLGAPRQRALSEGMSRLASPYLDAHTHVASPLLIADRAVSGAPAGNFSRGDGAMLSRRMDADGVRRAFVLSTAYLMAADAYGTRTAEAAEHARVRMENDFTAAECARDPDRLLAFLSVNPKRGYAVEEVDRCAEQKMRGLKLHLWNSLVDTRAAADLAALRRVVERAAYHRLPVVAHILVGAVPNYGPDDTERFVREIIMPFDTLQISLAHLAGAGGFAAQVQACFERLIALCGPDSPYASRVWVDMSSILVADVPSEARALGALLQQWGLHRVLWGSDNIELALERARSQWPLDAAAWQTIADQRGTALVAAR